MWCANGGSSTYCNDGGADWGQPPLGTSTTSQTGWTPGTFPYRGDSASKGSIACACMKDCTCKGDEKCWCVDPDQQPVGPGSYKTRIIIANSGKRGSCACFCNDVGARRRSLLAIGSTPTISLADLAPARNEGSAELGSSMAAGGAVRQLMGTCDCSKCKTTSPSASPSPSAPPSPPAAAEVRTHTYRNTHKQTYTDIHVNTHTLLLTCICTYTRTHTHTHNQV